MNMPAEVVVVKLGLNSYEINRIVIEKEKEGLKLKESYHPVKNGKLELTFEKPKKDTDKT